MRRVRERRRRIVIVDMVRSCCLCSCSRVLADVKTQEHEKE